MPRTRAAADRLRRVVTALLALFRANGEALWRHVDLADLIGHLSFDPLALVAQGLPGLDADPDLLAAALMSLLENSKKHGVDHCVRHGIVHAAWRGIEVRDDGQGVSSDAPAGLQTALDDQSYGAPLGLGLTRSDLVAPAHGGRLHLLRADHGFAVMLQLGRPPVAGAASPVA